MRFNDIGLAGRSAVGELIRGVISHLLHVIMHDFFVSEGCVFESDESLRGRGMFAEAWRGNSSARTCILSYIIVHHPVETIIIPTN
jgi:hypothetical protein